MTIKHLLQKVVHKRFCVFARLSSISIKRIELEYDVVLAVVLSYYLIYQFDICLIVRVRSEVNVTHKRFVLTTYWRDNKYKSAKYRLKSF